MKIRMGGILAIPLRPGQDPPVLLDECDHGLWFDRGELAHVFETHLTGETARRMGRLLKELLGEES